MPLCPQNGVRQSFPDWTFPTLTTVKRKKPRTMAGQVGAEMHGRKDKANRVRLFKTREQYFILKMDMRHQIFDQLGRTGIKRPP